MGDKFFLEYLKGCVTQLQTIINNDMSLECRCGHRKLVSVKELISRFSLAAKTCEVAR